MKRRQTLKLVFAHPLAAGLAHVVARGLAAGSLVAGAGGAPGAAFAATPAESAALAQDVAALLREGGCVLMLRHAQTEAGTGDPSNFNIDQCSTQRNLSPDGRAQAAAINRWFSSRSLVPSRVLSSVWCRCQDTARLAFGRFDVLPELGSTFGGRADATAQTLALQARLRAVAPGTFEVWVTHQVNVTALTGEVPSMGEAFVVSTSTTGSAVRVLARTQFA